MQHNKYSKIMLTGERGVGKTTLMFMFVQGIFPEHVWDQIDDSWRKIYEYKQELYILEIADINKNSDWYHSAITGSRTFILMYSINNRSTFEALPTYIE